MSILLSSTLNGFREGSPSGGQNTVPTITPSQVVLTNTPIPYMRTNQVEFFAQNLRPYKGAYFFFDSTNVNRFVQNASTLIVDTGNNATVNDVDDMIYCPSTYGFATVLGTSPPNLSIANNGGQIFLNENYVSISLGALSGNTITSSTFNSGDVIYQYPTAQTASITSLRTNGVLINSNTFTGMVEYFDYANNVLVLSPIYGTLNANSSGFSTNSNTWLYNANTTTVVGTTGILPSGTGGSKFLNNTIFVNLTKSITSLSNSVSGYNHVSGIVSTVANANTVIVQGNPGYANQNTIFITSGTGYGQSANVLSVIAQTGNTVLNLDANLSPTLDGTSTYSTGYPLPFTDENGVLCGIYQLPENPGVSFLSGTRVFTITDTTTVNDPNATMLAQASYTSFGYNQTISVNGTPTSPGGGSPSRINTLVVDTSSAPLANGLYNYSNAPASSPTIAPIAQIFTTPPPKSTTQNYGIFATSVDLWFSAKPVGLSNQFPVTLQICTVSNGIPTSNIIATSVVQSQNVAISTVPDSNTSNANNITVTKFSFPDPVYLNPSTQYAIVVSTPSPDYELYVSQIGGTDLTSGNNAARVSSTGFVGGFFNSQNSSAFNPVPNQNLMFVLNKAQFSQAPVTLDYTIQPTTTPVLVDSITTQSIDFTLPSTYITYAIESTLFNSTSNTFYLDPTYTEVTPGIPFNFAKSYYLNAGTGKRRYILPGNNASLQMQVDIQSYDPDISPMYNEESLSAVVTTNIVDNASIYPNIISISNDSGGHSNNANISVTFSAPNLTSGVQATGYVANSNILAVAPNGSKNVITGITMTNYGSGYITTPTATITDTTPGSCNSITVSIAGEDQSSGGNALSRYITKQIVLADGFDAGDLRVWVTGIVPNGANVVAYYKVLSSSDTTPFSNTKWQLMSAVNQPVSPDLSTPVQIMYAPSPLVNGQPSGKLSYTQNGVLYPLGGTFKYFAIKLVLLASDPTTVPVLSGLKVAAYPAG